MFRIFYAENDATLNEASEFANAGIDEILEIGKRLNTDGDALQKSRSVLKFGMTEILDTLSKYSFIAVSPKSWSNETVSIFFKPISLTLLTNSS